MTRYRRVLITFLAPFLIAASGSHHIRPRQSQPLRVCGIDLFQRAVARLSLRAAVAQPGSSHRVACGPGSAQHIVGHVRRDSGSSTCHAVLLCINREANSQRAQQSCEYCGFAKASH